MACEQDNKESGFRKYTLSVSQRIEVSDGPYAPLAIGGIRNISLSYRLSETGSLLDFNFYVSHIDDVFSDEDGIDENVLKTSRNTLAQTVDPVFDEFEETIRKVFALLPLRSEPSATVRYDNGVLTYNTGEIGGGGMIEYSFVSNFP